jgi:hypothetical protein
MECAPGLGRWLVAPEQLNEHFGGHVVVEFQQQNGEEGAFTSA